MELASSAKAGTAFADEANSMKFCHCLGEIESAKI